MARRRRKAEVSEEEVVMNFTSMLDVVFNILFFFVATFSPPAPERSFDINLPPPKLGQAGEAAANSDLPTDEEAVLFDDITITLTAGANGELAGIRIEQRQIEGGLSRLTAEIRRAAQQVVGLSGTKLDAAMIVAAPTLKYKHLIEVMDACRAADINKINFAEPKAAAK